MAKIHCEFFQRATDCGSVTCSTSDVPYPKPPNYRHSREVPINGTSCNRTGSILGLVPGEIYTQISCGQIVFYNAEDKQVDIWFKTR